MTGPNDRFATPSELGIVYDPERVPRMGRNGLVWLILDHKVNDKDPYYRHQITVDIIDCGVSRGVCFWCVPSVDDAAYVELSDLVGSGR